ncbi:MAG: TIGR03767 family metallophosphoesterase [Nocardioidaceae bacterium]|nr:TIGR03767 family metallophosphoesterase [Nocardioidaceae bacterium]
MSGVPALLTVDRTLVPGVALRGGTAGAYRAVANAPGEPHVVRTELEARRPDRSSRDIRPLLVFAHATDLQLADVQSPTRFEFCNEHLDDPRFHRLVPMHRPQEALAARAVQAMVRALNSLDYGPRSGADISLVITTGDAIDNAQFNELQMFLALFEGGLVRPGSGGPRYEGVQSLQWGDDSFWRPDGDGMDDSDWYQRRYGFPHLPGLMDRALSAFHSQGLRLPWLACFGNHELLVQGLGRVTEPVRQHLLGASKPRGSLAELDLDALEDAFIQAPERFLSGQQHVVTADPDRRAVGRREFVDAHFSPLSRPLGHGFTTTNRRSGTAYYVHDVGPVRLICLDTTSAAGAADGCVDEDQARWLRERLEEVHSYRLTAEGTALTTGHTDRLVILFSHHGIDTMTNNRTLPADPDGSRLIGGPELRDLLHRYANVVAWINGHAHRNCVTPRHDPLGRSGGFWEITSSALMDWPCQARLLELLDNGDGTLSLVCTMVDHDGVVSPEPDLPWTGRWLAGLHRELAGNEPWRGFGSAARGGLADRNVDLRLPAPFPLR